VEALVTRPMLAAIAAEVYACLTLHAHSYLPYLAFYFALDWAVRFGAPLFLGAPCFDALLAKEAPAEAALAGARLKLHRRVSQRVVAVVMALHVSALSLYGLLAPSISAPLQADVLGGSSPLTKHLCEVAVAYFLWDCLTCFDQGIEFAVHGVACLIVFACALVRCFFWRSAQGRAAPLRAHAHPASPPFSPSSFPTRTCRGPFSITWRW
jgi:hypothetical protein